MTSQSSHKPFLRVSGLAAVFAAVGALTWGVATYASDDAAPQVSVQVDEKPIDREAGYEPASYSSVVKKVAPAVVNVQVTQRARAIPADQMLPPFLQDPRLRQFFGFEGLEREMRQPPRQGQGSGVVVSPDGYILTNNHVVNGADEIQVSFNDGRELTAKVVGTDPQTDLAVIKVEAAELPAVTFADSELLEVGDRVLAVGNPFGIGQTVTSGMVGALGRASLGLDYEDFIQTDAAINPGNSGGALVDIRGRLVGINTAILSRSGGFQGIGFAIPSNLARSVMEQLVANGEVVRGFLGVNIQDLTPDLARGFDLEERGGALVADVSPDSPAEAGGLQSGDVITALNDRPVVDARRLKLAVGSLAPGTKVSATVVRDGETKELELEIGHRPGEERLAGSGRSFRNGAAGRDEGTLEGVAVSDLDVRARQEFEVPARLNGALVTAVEPDSAAARAGIRPGDVITEINRELVRNAADAVRLTENPASRETLVRIWSSRGVRYVVVDETEERSG
jgi:serine protease Do